MISPADAAVAARSFPRRWREVRSSPRAAAVAGHLDALAAEARAALAAELAEMGQRPGADLDAVAAQLADGIEAIGHDRWRDPDRLAALDRAIDAAAAALRDAERLVDPDD